MGIFVIGFLFGAFSIFALLCITGVISVDIDDDDEGDDDHT